MNYRKKLFWQKDPYNIEKTKNVFLNAVKEIVKFHENNCEDYSDILKEKKFDIDSIQTEEQLFEIPPLPTLYFKRHKVMSVLESKLKIKATSSGTKGLQSKIGFDSSSLFYGVLMMIRFFSYHKILSLLPTNYIVLGYQPSKHNQMGAIKTAYGTTKFAPALHREYALIDTGSSYEINIEGIKSALIRYAKQGFPVRFVGFPSYMYFLAKKLKDNNIKIKLNKHSKILMGGGWKQFSNQEIDRDEFYSLIKEVLGIDKSNCFEFFSAVEHPLPYVKCENGHFHVPIYSRVIIRDVKTLKPVANGRMGLLSFVSPLVSSIPITSIITDDLAVQHDGAKCECGIKTPYFDLLGRAGVSQIHTCTTDAAELLGGDEK